MHSSTTYSSTYESPVGTLTLASDGTSLVGLWLAGQKYFAATTQGELMEDATLPVFATARTWLDAYFAGRQPNPTALALAPQGSDFRQRVWEVLLGIPYGETLSYGEIAARLAAENANACARAHGGPGSPTPCAASQTPRVASQAVGGAVGHNPLSIIIPCHRVVGANGSLTGYAGGIDKKVWLLTHEGLDMSRFSAPTKGTAL